jgi:glycosyltransferase involved in cell wall biosynthesis
LKILKKYLVNNNYYCDDPTKSDVILVNSKDKLKESALLKEKYSKVLIHRIDGVFSIYRGKHEKHNDLMVYDFAKRHADGIIFQSNWSMKASKNNGMTDNSFETVIHNCSDQSIFYRSECNSGNKIRLITSSWSDNPKKGFGIYKYLDDHLNFDKYEYVFIGRSPVGFKNIKMAGLMSSSQISSEFQKAHVFVTAVQDDACSNSLTEALSCGLPSVVLNSGGSPEILKCGGELFESEVDVINKIEKVSVNLFFYKNRINIDGIEIIGKKYYDFMKAVYESK